MIIIIIVVVVSGVELVSRAQNGSDKEAQVGSATEESILEGMNPVEFVIFMK